MKSDPTKLGAGDDAYLCTTSENAANYREKVCSPHRISTKALRSIVLEVIRAASKSAIEDEAAFRETVLRESEVHSREREKELEKKLRQDKARFEDLDDLFQSHYESNHAGKISDRRFQMMSEKYEKEQTELETSIARTQQELDSLQTDTAKVDHFIALCRRYTDLTELTTPILNEFVNRIVVHEAEKIDGERTQHVEVYLNYIGKFELPEPELSPEELEELEKARKKRAKQREYSRAFRERKRQREAEKQDEGTPDDAA